MEESLMQPILEVSVSHVQADRRQPRLASSDSCIKWLMEAVSTAPSWPVLCASSLLRKQTFSSSP
jgi:hypothetical protein